MKAGAEDTDAEEVDVASTVADADPVALAVSAALDVPRAVATALAESIAVACADAGGAPEAVPVELGDAELVIDAGAECDAAKPVAVASDAVEIAVGNADKDALTVTEALRLDAVVAVAPDAEAPALDNALCEAFAEFETDVLDDGDAVADAVAIERD